VKYCPECGQKLASGTEKFCSECGQKLASSGEGEVTNIRNTSGDVLGAGVGGNKNVFGKEFAYTREGHAIVININNPSSQEFVEVFKDIMAVPTHVEQASITYKESNKTKLKESSTTQQHIKNVLEELNKIEKNTGTEIKEIKAGDLQISRSEISLKEMILKGNEYYYKKEYNEALKCYDKAIEINPNSANAWNNKGLALVLLSNYDEALKCYDKAIEINPNSANAWRNRGSFFNGLARREAIKCFDKSTSKYEEAIKCFDKALQINLNDADTWNGKGYALDNLGNYEEAIKCFDKALEIDPDDAIAQDNKASLLNILNEQKNKGSNKKIRWYTADGKPVYE